jgi:hypothetical protein
MGEGTKRTKGRRSRARGAGFGRLEGPRLPSSEHAFRVRERRGSWLQLYRELKQVVQALDGDLGLLPVLRDK